MVLATLNEKPRKTKIGFSKRSKSQKFILEKLIKVQLLSRVYLDVEMINRPTDIF